MILSGLEENKCYILKPTSLFANKDKWAVLDTFYSFMMTLAISKNNMTHSWKFHNQQNSQRGSK